MNLVESFCDEIRLYTYRDIEDIDYTTDQSEFEVVDGEEGDNGIIKYYSLSGDLLAVKTVYGGDSEDIEFTEIGKNILKVKALEIFNKNIDLLS